MSQQDDEKNDGKLAPAGALPLPPMPALPPLPNMDSQLPPAPAMDAPLPPTPLPLPPAPAIDAPLPPAPLPMPPAPAMEAPLPAALPLPPAPTPQPIEQPAPTPLPIPAPLPEVTPVATEAAELNGESSYGDLWAKRSDKPLQQIYGHIDRITNSDAGSLLDRYADRFGHSLDRDIIVLRKQEMDDKVSEVRDAPTVELLSEESSELTISDDMELSEQLAAVENELRSLKPEYQAAKGAGDAELLSQLKPQLEALIGHRKELQALIATSEENTVAEETVVAEEADGDDIFISFVAIVDDLLGSNLPEDVVEEFIASSDFQVYQQVGSDPHTADEELRAAFFAIVDGQLGNMDGADIQVFVESEQFEIYQAVGNMYQ